MKTCRTNIILLIEDNKNVRTLLRDFLENLGYNVLEAKNGDELLKIALSEIADLILMDLDLFNDGGFETIHQIRRRSRSSAIPIIAASADGQRGIELFQNIEKFGKETIEYITKPISLDDVGFYLNSMLTKVKKAA